MNEADRDKCKEILNKLFKQQLEITLNKCEKRTAENISTINLLKTTTKNSINKLNIYQNALDAYLKKKQEKNKQSKFSKIYQNKILKSKSVRKLTGYNRETFNYTCTNFSPKSIVKNRTINRNKTVGNLKDRKISSHNSMINTTVITTKSLKMPSKISNRTNEDNNIILLKKEENTRRIERRKKTPFNTHKVDTNEILNLSNNDNKNTKTTKSLKKTKSKIRPKLKNNNAFNSINTSNINSNLGNKTMEEFNISKILSIESNIEKDDLLVNNTTNLIDNESNNMIFSLKNIEQNNNHLVKLNIEDILNEDHFSQILDFLNYEEYIQIKNINKDFHNLVIAKIKNKLLDQKKLYEKKMGEINDIPEEYNFNNIEISKSTEKAIELLNGKSTNKVFTSNTIPNDDVIFIYKIFFYIIDNNIKDISDKKIFWNKTCEFFMIKNEGKTGNFLKNIYTNKLINITDKNTFKLANLLKNNLNKILPAYFSKICGTTGLFVFFIKDILDFIGITLDKKHEKNIFWTYNKLIKYIQAQINLFQEYKKFI